MLADILGLGGWAFAGAVAVTLLAGFVKGAVGFAMPTIMISGLGSFLPAETALAALILPTLATNFVQAVRQGWRAAARTALGYWRLIAALAVMIALTAQLVTSLPRSLFFALLGVPILIFALAQLRGYTFAFAPAHRGRAEVLTGLASGAIGGMSGVWGPPVIAFLLSTRAEKRENVRVQGVVYLIGSVTLLVAHLRSGVLDAATLPLSAAMLVPAGLGLGLGFVMQDRLDQARFRRWTLVVLALAGLNLIRRALVG